MRRAKGVNLYGNRIGFTDGVADSDLNHLKMLQRLHNCSILILRTLWLPTVFIFRQIRTWNKFHLYKQYTKELYSVYNIPFHAIQTYCRQYQSVPYSTWIITLLYNRHCPSFILPKHADPTIPDSPEEWLDEFSTFSIYQVLPKIIELWGLNVQTDVESKKTSRNRSADDHTLVSASLRTARHLHPGS